MNTVNYLDKYGIRPSVQRLAIMEHLLTNHTHPTAEGIYLALHPSMPTLSRTTVYNTLSMLATRGAILALDIDPAQTHYDSDTSHHAHFMCTHCGLIRDIPLTDDTLHRIPTPAGVTITNVQLSYKGLCAQCANVTNY